MLQIRLNKYNKNQNHIKEISFSLPLSLFLLKCGSNPVLHMLDKCFTTGLSPILILGTITDYKQQKNKNKIKQKTRENFPE